MTKEEVMAHVDELMKSKQSVFTVVHKTDKNNPFEKIESFAMLGNKRNMTSMDNPMKIAIKNSNDTKVLPMANPALS